MKSCFSPKLWLLVALVTTPGQAQTVRPKAGADDPGAVATSLADLLSLETFGTIMTHPEAARVVQSGSEYLIKLPLAGFSMPANAAVSVVAHLMGSGMWDIASMTFPSTGTIEPPADNIGSARITYTIGEQTVHGLFDPALTRSSSFAANLGNIKIRSDQGDRHSEQTFERYIADGTVVADLSGRLNLTSRGKATNWHMTMHAPNVVDTTAAVRTLSSHFAADGLDRAQAMRLLSGARALTMDDQTSSSGQPSGRPAAQHRDFRPLVDALPGLSTRFQGEEALDDIRFAAGPARSGTIGQLRVNMAGDVANDRLNARLDIAVDGLAMTTLQAEAAAYMPHRVQMKAAMAGVRTVKLVALLRAAAEPGADSSALLTQFMAISTEPEARIGIESLMFDAGPLQVTGSARVVPLASGQAGADIHLSATGMDALIAQSQGNPALQQELPVMFIAKGMGRPAGDAMTWDIAVGDGSITVNGLTLGQPSARKR